jgi:predicted nuclease of restriction endonuclease-like RecB superfamily
MLTKDLLQATVRNGKLFPRFLPVDDATVLDEARQVCELFVGAKGRVIGEIEEELKAMANKPRGRAFAKLLMDRCEIAEASEATMNQRWQAFAVSERLRREGQMTHEAFSEAMSAHLGTSLSDLRQVIFSDLPASRIVEAFDPVEPLTLVGAYNLSHVTTFLCMAASVSVTLGHLSLAQKREMMRRLRFHRLK